MKIKEGFMLREVAGNYVVVPVGKASLTFKGAITLNETGSFLWKCLEKETNEIELVECLLKEYEVTKEVAEQGVRDFVKKIVGAGLVE